MIESLVKEGIGLPVFLKTLAVLIPENEGIVINVPSDLKNHIPYDRAIVFNMNDEIGIMEEHQGFLEGQRIAIQ